MACIHRFYGKHQFDSLLPDWEIDYLFIGTFNPEWTINGNQQAEYFYGRTQNNYFWKLVPELWEGKQMTGNGLEHWLPFLRKNRIGITDLIVSIDDADYNNPVHQKKIKSMADKELVRFKQLKWNTDSIIAYLGIHPNVRVIITNLTAPIEIEEQIQIIANATKAELIRLRTPSKGARFHLPKPLYNSLLQEWERALRPILGVAQ